MATIAVTGAAGFIGSHVCEALLARGERVVGIDSFDDFYDPAIKRRNLANCTRHAEFALLQADIRDGQAMNAALERGVDAVVHLAARAGVRPSIADPVLYTDVNVNGTAILLEAARQAGIPRFIFASSSSVYGNNPKVPFAETDRVDNPISPYAATKKAGELLCHTYAHLFGMNITCLRFFTVYGPRQRPDLAIHKFARLILAGEPIPVFGDGSTSRDYTYIADTVDGVLRALDRCRGYHIYNLGEAEPITLSELIAAIEQAVGTKAVVDRRPSQPGDVKRTYADIALAQRDLDYKPTIALSQGLSTFVAWLQDSACGPEAPLALEEMHHEYLVLLTQFLKGEIAPRAFRDGYISLWLSHRDLRRQYRSQFRDGQKRAKQLRRAYQEGQGSGTDFSAEWSRLWAYDAQSIGWIDQLHSTVSLFTEDERERAADPQYFTVTLEEMKNEVKRLHARATGKIVD